MNYSDLMAFAAGLVLGLGGGLKVGWKLWRQTYVTMGGRR